MEDCSSRPSSSTRNEKNWGGVSRSRWLTTSDRPAAFTLAGTENGARGTLFWNAGSSVVNATRACASVAMAANRRPPPTEHRGGRCGWLRDAGDGAPRLGESGDNRERERERQRTKYCDDDAANNKYTVCTNLAMMQQRPRRYSSTGSRRRIKLCLPVHWRGGDKSSRRAQAASRSMRRCP